MGKLGGRLELWQLDYQKENQSESMASLGPRARYISEAFRSPDVISMKMGSWHLCSYAVLITPDRVSGNGERTTHRCLLKTSLTLMWSVCTTPAGMAQRGNGAQLVRGVNGPPAWVTKSLTYRLQGCGDKALS